MQARHFKIVLWISVLIVVFQLGRSDAVLNALFLFAAVGAVPGTHIMLQPNDVFWALGGILALGVLLIFATNLQRGIVRLFRRAPVIPGLEPLAIASALSAAPVKAKKTSAAKVPKPKIVVVIKPVRRPGKLRLAIRAIAAAVQRATWRAGQQGVATARAHYPRLAAALGRFWGNVKLGIRTGAQAAVRAALAAERAAAAAWRHTARLTGIAWRRFTQLAGIAWRRSVALMHIGGRLLRREVIHAAILTGRASVRAWAWLEPRLQIFDYWLGVQYHTGLDAFKRHDTTKTISHVLKEANKVIATGRAEVREALTRVVEK